MAPERRQLTVHIDAAALTKGEKSARCETDQGSPISVETARRLGCDAALVAVIEGEEGTLGSGRRTRAVPAQTRRALAERDRGCRFPGCTARRRLEAHHIHHWARGGETSLANLAELCRAHHRLLHEGGFDLHRASDGSLVFRRPDGRPLPASPAPPPGHHAGLSHRSRRAGLTITPETVRGPAFGERFDLDHTALVLCARDDPVRVERGP